MDGQGTATVEAQRRAWPWLVAAGALAFAALLSLLQGLGVVDFEHVGPSLWFVPHPLGATIWLLADAGILLGLWMLRPLLPGSRGLMVGARIASLGLTTATAISLVMSLFQGNEFRHDWTLGAIDALARPTVGILLVVIGSKFRESHRLCGIGLVAVGVGEAAFAFTAGAFGLFLWDPEIDDFWEPLTAIVTLGVAVTGAWLAWSSLRVPFTPVPPRVQTPEMEPPLATPASPSMRWMSFLGWAYAATPIILIVLLTGFTDIRQLVPGDSEQFITIIFWMTWLAALALGFWGMAGQPRFHRVRLPLRIGGLAVITGIFLSANDLARYLQNLMLEGTPWTSFLGLFALGITALVAAVRLRRMKDIAWPALLLVGLALVGMVVLFPIFGLLMLGISDSGGDTTPYEVAYAALTLIPLQVGLFMVAAAVWPRQTKADDTSGKRHWKPLVLTGVVCLILMAAQVAVAVGMAVQMSPEGLLSDAHHPECSVHRSSSDSSVALYGWVRNADGEPLPDANITFSPTRFDRGRDMAFMQAECYNIGTNTIVTGGPLNVTALAPGYLDKTYVIPHVEGGQAYEVNFVLDRA